MIKRHFAPAAAGDRVILSRGAFGVSIAVRPGRHGELILEVSTSHKPDEVIVAVDQGDRILARKLHRTEILPGVDGKTAAAGN